MIGKKTKNAGIFKNPTLNGKLTFNKKPEIKNRFSIDVLSESLFFKNKIRCNGLI